MFRQESFRGDRFHFTIRGLFILTFGLAVGAADQNWREGSWADRTRSALLVVSAWIVVGLIEQAWQALQCGRLAPQVAAHSRRECPTLWEIIRPLGLAAVLVFYHVVEHFDARQFPPGGARIEHRWWIDTVYCLAMAAVLIEVIQQSRAPRRCLPPFFFVPAWALGIVFATLACYERLVQVASIQQAVRHASRDALRLESFDLADPSFWLGLGLALWVPASVASLYFVARGSRRRVRRIGYAAVLTTAVIGMAAALAVNLPLARIAAGAMLETPSGRQALAHLARIIVPGVLVLLTALAANWARFWPPSVAFRSAKEHPCTERTVQDVPLYRRPAVLWLLVGVILVEVVSAVARNVMSFQALGAELTAGALLAVLFTYESTLFMAALIGLAAAAAWQAHSAAPPPAEQPPPLPLGRFAFFWFGSMIISALAVGLLALYGFALRLAVQ